MSRLSIFQTQWIDLVFENRNKTYGAYQLRQESTQTSLKALALTCLMVLSVYAIFSVVSFFNPTVILETPEIPAVVLEVTDLNFLEKPKPPKQAALPPAQQPSAEPTKQNLARPTVVDQTQATAIIPDNASAAATTVSTSSGLGSVLGTGSAPSTNTNPTPQASNVGNNIIETAELDKNPEFPGGIKVFLNYVATNFRPADELENTIKVTVSFVVEKDGSMTNIQVRNNQGYGMGDEAIRVLKSMKTKWQAGVKDGQKVRAHYNLPITIQL
jgi:protein TonB